MKAARFGLTVNEEMELFTLDPTIARPSLVIRATRFEQVWMDKPSTWGWEAEAVKTFGVSIDALYNHSYRRGIKDTIIAACNEQAAKRNMKQKAATLNLKFWPALYARDVDPRAFVAAEDVLSQQHGLWDGKKFRGGWDAMGHHGLSGHDVRKMWFAAGCRNSPKFQMQVRKGIVAKRTNP